MVKNPSANEGDAGSVPGLGRSQVQGNGNPLQYFCLGNPMDSGACSGLLKIKPGRDFPGGPVAKTLSSQ